MGLSVGGVVMLLFWKGDAAVGHHSLMAFCGCDRDPDYDRSLHFDHTNTHFPFFPSLFFFVFFL